MGFSIRAMSRAELETAVGWAAAEGWNPGHGDAGLFQLADPLGFLVGDLDGTPIAAISAVRYGVAYGFIGFYIVAPAWRGRGYGIRVWRAGMARLADIATIGLDGVLAEEASYARAGFQAAYRNRRYGGALPRGATMPGLVDARSIPMRALVELDRTMFPADRAGFLAAWIGAPGHVALVALVDGQVAGLGVLRPCRSGAKIGPLYARDPATAAGLVRGLCAGLDQGPVYLDVPAINAEAVAVAESFGWTASFETARMYRGPAPRVDLDRLYGVTTFELG